MTDQRNDHWIMNPDEAQSFEKNINLLQETLQKMRAIADKMMPEILVKSGLAASLQQLCDKINQGGTLKVSCQCIGPAQLSPDIKTALNVYRIAEQLLDNVQRHASAKNAVLQVNQEAGLLRIKVTDDGKGFDPSILRQRKTSGFGKVSTLVETMNGMLNIDSVPGRGTSVHLEVSA